MAGLHKCPFCSTPLYPRGGGNHIKCSCENCGNFKISGEAFENLPYEFETEYKNEKFLIAGYLRELNDLGLEPEIITNQNFLSILNSGFVPKTLGEKLNKLLLHIYRKSESIFKTVDIKLANTAIAYATSGNELIQMLKALQEEGLIKGCPEAIVAGKPLSISMTIKGIERAEVLVKSNPKENQCFVAMWFSDEMMNVYEKYMTLAISNAGYKPLIISQKEHNDKICDHIIAEIRKSRFVVADFTAHRGGVYFEAGFAYGLGKPVIWTCRKDHLNAAHFDVNHYNFIVWETGEDLQSKLLNRIKATIL